MLIQTIEKICLQKAGQDYEVKFRNDHSMTNIEVVPRIFVLALSISEICFRYLTFKKQVEVMECYFLNDAIRWQISSLQMPFVAFLIFARVQPVLMKITHKYTKNRETDKANHKFA